MKVQSINNNTNNNNSPNFGHSFRVSISVLRPDGGYDFVNPATNKKLYKSLNSKIITWLNEDFKTRVRNVLNVPKKCVKTKTETEDIFKNNLTAYLRSIDDDYKSLDMVRSVYNKKRKLGSVVTGVDAAIVEKNKGATRIGIAKNGFRSATMSRTTAINDAVGYFDKESNDYAGNPINFLRSKAGKEMMLRVNFKVSGKTKRGKDIYEPVNFDFHEIKKSQPISPEKLKLKAKKDSYYYEVLSSLIYTIRKFTDKNITKTDIDRILEPQPKAVIEQYLPFKDW